MNQRTLFEATTATATISPDGLYRYDLTRSWGWDGFSSRRAAFLMLNPSKADATRPDPTMTRCVNYARSWGYGGMVIVNLFAFRSTDPDELRKAADPIGPDNDRYIAHWAVESDLLVCAWGAHPFAVERASDVLRLLSSLVAKPHCLCLTKDGHPGHPLMLRSGLQPIPMEAAIP
jgi:hypothetical protein